MSNKYLVTSGKITYTGKDGKKSTAVNQEVVELSAAEASVFLEKNKVVEISKDRAAAMETARGRVNGPATYATLSPEAVHSMIASATNHLEARIASLEQIISEITIEEDEVDLEEAAAEVVAEKEKKANNGRKAN